MRPQGSERGFTLVEMLIVSMITLAILGALGAAVLPAQRMLLAQSEAADVQQRTRVAVETLRVELASAVPPIRPYRDDGNSAPDHQRDVVSVTQHAGRLRSFYLRTDPRAGLFQLVQSDDGLPAAPLLDDVVLLEFEYFGDPQPPQVLGYVRRGGRDEPQVSYGPTPPALHEDNPTDAWGPGENCTFRVVNAAHLPVLAALGSAGPPVLLPGGMLADGPWCPDPAHSRRYDADLLRVRRVRVRLRVQAPPAFRGFASTLFAQAGSARDPALYVADQEVRFDVAVRSAAARE